MHLYHTFDNRKQSVHAVIGAVVSSFGRQDKAPVVADADNVTAATCFTSCEDDSVSRDVYSFLKLAPGTVLKGR